MENEIELISQQLQDEIIDISNYIFEHPELGDSEYESSAFLADLLQKNGFRVQYPYCNLKTAFRAEFGNPTGAKIALLPEYDALPGYGAEKKPAHACGHNWIAASTIGAALILSKLKNPLDGSVVLLGTPAEETLGRKVDLINAGAFKDISAVLQMHLGGNTNLHVSALAIDSWKFEFFGKASHAAAFPFYGINALDAVNLTFSGINALRQQLKSDVRIHGIITDGGETPNIIPNYASCKFYVRAKDRAYLDEVSEKVKNCARGAALMTGAEFSISKFENSFDNLKVNPVLKNIMSKNLIKCGIDDFCEEPELAGSTDIGNVSYCVPTFYGNVGVGGGKARAHEKEFLQHVNSSEAHLKLLKVANAFAYTACELFSNQELIDKINAGFNESR
jgi:amidohydrolase